MMIEENTIPPFTPSLFLQSSSLHYRLSGCLSRSVSSEFDRTCRLKGKWAHDICVEWGKRVLGLTQEGRSGGHTVDVFGVCVCMRDCTEGIFVGEGIWRNTHTHSAHDITAYRAAGRNVTEKGEALWRRGKRREGRKRRRRRGGKGLAREKSGTPTIWNRTEQGWTEGNRAK